MYCLFSHFLVCVCAGFATNQTLSSAPPNQVPVPGSLYFSCGLIIDVFLCNTINVSVFWTLEGFWIVIPSLPSWVHYRSIIPSFDALRACALLYMSLHVHIVPNSFPGSLCGWSCKSLHLVEEGQNHPSVRFAYPCHMIGESLVFLSCLYIKLFGLGVEVSFTNRSAVTHRKVNILTFPMWEFANCHDSQTGTDLTAVSSILMWWLCAYTYICIHIMHMYI